MKITYTLTFLLLISSLSSQAALYRWEDASGKVHYSDKIPPEMAQSGHVKLNKNGTMKERVASAEARRTQLEEIEEERALMEKMKAQKQKEDLQEMRDTQLLSMFSTEEELINVYNSKLEMTDGSIQILKARHKKLSETLEEVEARHERTVNPNDKNKIGMRIEDILDNLHVYQQAITENLIERSKIEVTFAQDLARFKVISKNRRSRSK
jgi:hypothetical protein